ncbi:MAG TPA: hypothetical protein VL381_00275 [Rhodocyclaceae bacterium]|jgi:hypothetical protein|nr:hypothetical protein [Rhodocyclaceae bacterium]
MVRPRLTTVAIILALLIAAVLWLKAEHTPVEAIKVAQTFITHLGEHEYPQAYELTVRRAYVGTTANELANISKQQFCKVNHMVSTSPFQSNGNRLRRWLSEQEVEMPEIRVEFEGGACLLGVTVNNTAAGWRVSKFASHAG